MNLPNAYARINLENLAWNYRSIKERAKDKTVICIVKADAYGHGAVQCAKKLEETGAEYFAVASLDEAKELREAGIKDPILILGYIPLDRVCESIAYDLTYTVYSLIFADELERCAAKENKQVNVHLKYNTGMNRLGFRDIDALVSAALHIRSQPHLKIEGLFSHYATADEADLAFTTAQHALFVQGLNKLRSLGFEIPMVHISNSAGIEVCDSELATAVRPGIILYGIHPSAEVEEHAALSLKPVMTFYSRIANIAKLEPGDSVSYGRKFTADKMTKTAVVCAGYADGYFRILSNKAQVLVRGQRANILGNICMDMFMIDVTDIAGVTVGDEVTLFGDGLPVTELSELAGTIPYELTCSVSKRVKRIY